MDIFGEKRNAENFIIRKDLEDFIEKLSKIPIDPNRNFPEPRIIEYLPFHWELNQIYSILDYLCQEGILKNIFFIVINKDFEIIDVFLLLYKIKGKNEERILKLKIKNLKKNNIEFLEEIEQLIQDNSPIRNKTEDYLSAKYNLDSVQTFILPQSTPELLKNLDLPLVNLNIIEFFLKMKEIEKSNFFKLSRNRYILKESLNGFSYKKKITEFLNIFSNIDLKKWAAIWGTLLDDLMINLIIMNKTRIMVAGRFIVEDKKFTFNPLPSHVYKPTLRDESYGEIAEDIYEKTGLRTLICETDDVQNLIEKVFSKHPNILNLVTDIFEWSEGGLWYPNSLLNSFLKLFGFTIGNDIEQFSDAFKTVLENFQNILIVTYRIYPEKKQEKSYQTLVHLTLKNGEPTVKLIDSENYKEFLSQDSLEPIDRLATIKNEIEKNNNIKFSACLGFDINILAESISMKNIESLLKIKNMAHQLPFVASLGALFAGMKALNVEKVLDSEDAILKITENNKAALIEEPLKFREYFDAFLKKGILFISEEEKSMGSIRHPIYSKDGFLGLDMDLIRDKLEKNNRNKNLSD